MNAIGYMIQDTQGNAIFGVGQTVDEAWVQVLDCAKNDMGGAPWADADGDPYDLDDVYACDFKTYGATSALIDYVNKNGGDIVWSVTNGVAHLPTEEI